MKKGILLVAVIISGSSILRAQENGSMRTRKFQVTFAYPVGSNGMDALNYANNFSFNILYGLNGGVNGYELGSILNYNKGEVSGFQLAGVSNITGADSKGFILSGVANVSSGITNGALISGVLNYSEKKTSGFSMAGVSNICTESASGILLSGVMNYSAQKSNGFCLAGVSNICTDSVTGFYLSGVLNYSNSSSQGFHLAVINVTENQFSGFQLGVVNYAAKLKGVQLGVLNIPGDCEKGLPVGILSIVKNGHYEFELTAGEVIYSNLTYKMGVERLYTVYKLGYSVFKTNPVYSFGLGFGGNIPLSGKHNLNIDLTSNSIVYDNTWDGELNLLNKLDLNYKYNIFKNLCLVAGPSFNVYVTREKIDGGYGTINIPYTIYENEGSEGKLFIWLGLNAGLSLKI